MNKEIEFPAIYLNTNTISVDTKSNFEKYYLVNLILLVLASFLGAIKFDDCVAGLFIKISGCLYFVSLILTLIFLFMKYERKWYLSRAFSESVKSLTWKYIIGGEPFFVESDKDSVDLLFLHSLRKLYDEVKGKNIFKNGNFVPGEQITDDMTKIRSLTFQERLKYYKEYRINDQLEWYKTKGKYNGKMSQIYFTIIIILLSVSFIYLVFLDPLSIPIKLTSIMATLTSSLLAWLQVKKHQELSEAYTLTAQDINLIKSSGNNISNDKSLSIFVSDTETAFSREHTMWLARRDALN